MGRSPSLLSRQGGSHPSRGSSGPLLSGIVPEWRPPPFFTLPLLPTGGAVGSIGPSDPACVCLCGTSWADRLDEPGRGRGGRAKPVRVKPCRLGTGRGEWAAMLAADPVAAGSCPPSW